MNHPGVDSSLLSPRRFCIKSELLRFNTGFTDSVLFRSVIEMIAFIQSVFSIVSHRSRVSYGVISRTRTKSKRCPDSGPEADIMKTFLIAMFAMIALTPPLMFAEVNANVNPEVVGAAAVAAAAVAMEWEIQMYFGLIGGTFGAAIHYCLWGYGIDNLIFARRSVAGILIGMMTGPCLCQVTHEYFRLSNTPVLLIAICGVISLSGPYAVMKWGEKVVDESAEIGIGFIKRRLSVFSADRQEEKKEVAK